jgi:hypothetical protein
LDDSAQDLLNLLDKKETKTLSVTGKPFVSGVPNYAIYLENEEEWIGKDANTNGIN